MADKPKPTASPAPAAPASGAPDSPKPAVIWNERNELVDPELDAHFKAEHHKVMGNDPETGEPLSTPLLRTDAPPNTPQVSQLRESQTADPLSNPQPNADPNNRPSPLGTTGKGAADGEEGATEQADVDAAVIEEAKAQIDRSSETLEGQALPPVIGTEAGNVRGNPAGAQGGVVPAPNTSGTPPAAPPTEPPGKTE